MRPALRGPGAALARGLGADRRGLPAWAADEVGGQVYGKVALAQPAVARRAFGDRREDVDVALGELGADRPGAIGGVGREAPGLDAPSRRRVRISMVRVERTSS